MILILETLPITITFCEFLRCTQCTFLCEVNFYTCTIFLTDKGSFFPTLVWIENSSQSISVWKLHKESTIFIVFYSDASHLRRLFRTTTTTTKYLNVDVELVRMSQNLVRVITEKVFSLRPKLSTKSCYFLYFLLFFHMSQLIVTKFVVSHGSYYSHF